MLRPYVRPRHSRRRAAKILASPRLADGAEERQLTWALAGLAAGTAVLFAWSIAAGMAVMAFLVYMNRTFVLVGRGYPAAPRTSARVEPALSEVEGNPRPTAFDHIALSIGIGWAISSLILRYGGLRP